jgi:hypothetical protein
VIVDADAAQPPFGKHVWLDRQRLERRPVEFFQQRTPRAAEATDRSLFVEPLEQFADRRVQLGETVEHAIAQATDQPALDDEQAGFDFGLVAWPIGARRQHGGAGGTPPIAAKACVCAPIQSASPCVQVASTYVKFEAPITAMKIWAWRALPVSRSMITGTVSPA